MEGEHEEGNRCPQQSKIAAEREPRRPKRSKSLQLAGTAGSGWGGENEAGEGMKAWDVQVSSQEQWEATKTLKNIPSCVFEGSLWLQSKQ